MSKALLHIQEGLFYARRNESAQSDPLSTFIKHVTCAVCLVLLGVLLLSCQGSDSRLRIVKIGLVAPLSGEGFSEGYRWLYAAKEAIAAWNATAVAKPYRVELVTYDEAEGPLVARRLAVDTDVLAVLGYQNGGTMTESLEAYREGDLGLLTVGAANDEPQPAQTPPYVFRLAPSQESLARATGLFVKQQLRKPSAALVAGPTLQALASSEVFRVGASAAGLPIIRAEAVLPYSTDYLSVIKRLQEAAADVVLYSGSAADAQDFLRQLTASRAWTALPPVVLTPSAAGPEVLRGVQAGLGEVYWASPAADPRTSEAGRAFWEAYQDHWKEPPSPGATVVYDGTSLLLQAIETVMNGPDAGRRQAVLGYLQGLSVYRGLAQQYQFDGRGQLLNPSAYFFRLDEGGYPGTFVAKVSVPASAH